MSKPVALVSADWHIRKNDRIWNNRPEIYGDTSWSIEQILRIARRYDVAYVWLLGDLFEQPMQRSDALLVMRNTLDAFADEKRQVWYVHGQHERSCPPILSALHKWPTHIHQQELAVPELARNNTVYGLDYCNPLEIDVQCQQIPKCTSILLTHQVWSDWINSLKAALAFNDVPHARLIMTGDYHVSMYRSFGKKQVLSPGSICLQKINETPDKAVWLLFDDLSVKEIPLVTRQLYTSTIHNDDELELFLSTWQRSPARIPQPNVPTEIATNLIRMHYVVDIPDVKQRVSSVIGAEAHMFFEPILIQSPEISVEDTQRREAVLNGGLAECINTFCSDQPAIRQDALRLLRVAEQEHGSLTDELVSIFQERML